MIDEKKNEDKRTDRKDPEPQPAIRNDGEQMQVRRDCFRQG